MSRSAPDPMKRLILHLPDGAALWLKGYAAAQKISVSRTAAVLCLEQRARFAKESQKRHARFIQESEQLKRRNSVDSPSPPPSPIEGEGADF